MFLAVGVVICSNAALISGLPEAGLTRGIFVDELVMTSSFASGSIHMVCARAPTACFVPLKIYVPVIIVLCGIITGVLAPVCVAICSALSVECVIVILGSSPDASKFNLV